MAICHGLRFCRGSKCAISHWLGLSPLTQCWGYRAACDKQWAKFNKNRGSETVHCHVWHRGSETVHWHIWHRGSETVHWHVWHRGSETVHWHVWHRGSELSCLTQRQWDSALTCLTLTCSTTSSCRRHESESHAVSSRCWDSWRLLLHRYAPLHRLSTLPTHTRWVQLQFVTKWNDFT